MTITNTFECNELSAEKIRYETCLIRQQAMMLPNSKCRNPKYPVCYFCDKGKEIKAKFPDWKYMRNSKHRKPDRIYLKKDKRVRNYEHIKDSGMSAKVISDKPEVVKPSPFPPPTKPFNAKLFVQAQGQYIKALIKQKKTVEAKERIDMVINELSTRGLNYREFEDYI